MKLALLIGYSTSALVATTIEDDEAIRCLLQSLRHPQVTGGPKNDDLVIWHDPKDVQVLPLEQRTPRPLERVPSKDKKTCFTFVRANIKFSINGAEAVWNGKNALLLGPLFICIIANKELVAAKEF